MSKNITSGDILGSGGTGTVYAGEDDTVFKVTRAGEELAQKDLLNEFMLLSKLDAIENVPKTIDAGQIKDENGDVSFYMQMSRIEGKCLSEVHTRMSSDELETVRGLISDTYNQLSTHGFYHGDPGGMDNYLVTQVNGEVSVNLCDFAEGGVDKTGALAIEEGKQVDSVLRGMIRSAQQKEPEFPFSEINFE